MEISVEDDGPGVPEAEWQRIFEPFARLDRSRDRETGGYGLGLAIVGRVMELHGGRAEATGCDLGGACFRLRWPTD
jgi:two-component system sensor histidine kinase RstB